MTEIVNRSTLVAYVRGGEGQLLLYAANSETAITTALDSANSEGIAALDRSGRYLVEAVDALTPETAPSDLQNIVHARALHHLTASGGTRPDIIGTAATDADKQLGLIATANRIIRGIAAASSSAGRAADSVTHRRRGDRVFDRENVSQAYNRRDEEI